MLLESLLFVATEPVPTSHLAQVLQATAEAVEDALAQLDKSYKEHRRGIRLQHGRDGVRLTSAPEATTFVERFLGLTLTSKLSRAALETLAIIAYRQPLTRADIEAVRGVNCDGVLRTLIIRGLVEPTERLEQAGRPFLYGTTSQFLQYFGIESLEALPPLPDEQVSGEVLGAMKDKENQ